MSDQPRPVTTTEWTIRPLVESRDEVLEGLTDLLIDCVDGGASISFMAPLDRRRALEFWRGVIASAMADERVLLIAEDAAGICGSVQVVFRLPENQPHRGEVAKMLVHHRARRRGVATALMRAAEGEALARGKTLLVLDAVTGGDAARLYESLGWKKAGDIPGYALFPTGGLCSTTFYYRELQSG